MSTSKIKPIIFSGDMIRAILGNRKSQTRRVIKPQPIGIRSDWSQDIEPGDRYMDSLGIVWKALESRGRNMAAAGELTKRRVTCPYGRPGYLLWVRETWREDGDGYAYRGSCLPTFAKMHIWRPSIFMPRRASRLTLRITDVRVQRVQEISEEDAIAEGVARDGLGIGSWIRPFSLLWDSLNLLRGYSWESNPYVWVIEFVKEQNHD